MAIVADGDGFDDSLRQSIDGAAGAADRASRTLGRRVGTNVTASATQAMSGLDRAFERPLRRLRGSFATLGRSLDRSLSPGSRAAQTLTTSLDRVRDAATATRDTFSSLGDAASTAFAVGRDNLDLLRRGLRGIGVSASQSNAAFYQLGQTLTQVGARASSALSTLPQMLQRAGTSLANTHRTLNRFGQILGRVGVAGAASLGGITAVMTALPAAASLAATSAAGAFATGIAAIGIVAAAQSEQVQAEFTALAEHTVDTLTGMAGPIERALSSLAGDLTGLLDDLAPSLERSFAALGPSMEGFFSEITGSLRSLGPLSETASTAFADLLDVLGPALGGAVERLSASLNALFASSDPDFFTRVVIGVVDFAIALVDLVTWLSEARSGLAEDLAPAARALAPLVSGLAEGLSTAGQAAAEFAGEFLDQAVPAVEAMGPLLADFGSGFEAAGELIAGLLDDLAPALSALEPFVEGFTEGFIQARDIIIGFLSDLLGQLGPAEGALESLATWLGENEELVRLMGVAVGSVVSVLATYRLAAIAATLASTLLSRSFLAVGAGIRAIPVVGWIITGIGLLIVVVQQLWERSETFREIVTNAWDRVSGALEDAWEIISEVFDAFGEGWDRLVAAAQTDTGIGRVWEGIQDAVSTAWGVLQPIFDQIAETWQFVSGLITGDTSLSDLGGLIESYFSNLGSIGENIAGFLIRQMERVPGLVLDALGFLGNEVAPWLAEQLSELPGVAVEHLAELGRTIGGWFTSLPDRIAEWVGATDGWLVWLQDLGDSAVEHLQGLGESIAEYIQGIPDMIRERVDGEAILEFLREAPGRIVEFMADYGPQILRGLAIAIGVVVLGIPALLLGLLGSILFVLGVIAWELIQWAHEAFTDMAFSAGQAIGQGINNIVLWFQQLPGRLLAAVSSLGARLVAWGLQTMAELRASLASGLTSLRTWWDTTWNNIVGSARGIWDGFVAWATGAAVRLRDAVMGPIRTLAERMVTAFDGAREGIQRAWSAVRGAVAAPIEWVVNVGYNEWIRGVWEKVIDKFGGPALPAYTVKFAKGGIFPGRSGGGAAGVFSGYTPGRDVHAMPMAAFSGGESVLRPEITRAWGARTTLLLNKLARAGGVRAVRRALMMLFGGHNPFTGMAVPAAQGRGGGGFSQRFARGGILGSVGGAASNTWRWLNSRADDFTDGMLDFLDDPKGMLKSIFDQVMDYSQMPGSSTGWGQVLQGLPKRIIRILLDKAKELFSFDGDWTGLGGNVGGRLGAALAFAKAQAGKPYIWGGVGPRGYDCSGFISAIHNVILGRRPYSRRYTTHPFTGSAYGGFRRNMPSPFMIGVTHANVGHMAGTLLRTNVESRGSAGAVVGARARGYNNSLFSHRYGMVGAASPRSSRMAGEGILYDSGGWLTPGVHLVGNFTGKPESIRTWAQERNVSRLVRLLERQMGPGSTALVPADRREAFSRAMAREGAPLGGTVVNAPITVTTVVADPAQVATKVVDRLVQRAGI